MIMGHGFFLLYLLETQQGGKGNIDLSSKGGRRDMQYWRETGKPPNGIGWRVR
jgi:hypothetical protein